MGIRSILMVVLFSLGSNGYGAEKEAVDVTEDYKIAENPIGNGSIAAVYKGWHRRIRNKAVAIRRIELEEKKNSNEKWIRLIQGEADSLFSQLRFTHPSLLKVLSIYHTKTHLDAVLPLMEGGDLFELIHANKPEGLPPHTAVGYLQHILDAIAYLHEQGIIHRDIKPENILFEKKAEKGTFPISSWLRVGDFGLSRQAKKIVGEPYLCGTVGYMAPEILEKRTYDNRVDVWAIACVFYNMLFIADPFPFFDDPIKDRENPDVKAGRFCTTRPAYIKLAPNYHAFFVQIFQAHIQQPPCKRPSCRKIQAEYPWAQILHLPPARIRIPRPPTSSPLRGFLDPRRRRATAIPSNRQPESSLQASVATKLAESSNSSLQEGQIEKD